MYLLKPFPASSLSAEQRIFNHRLSRMQRISENVLGIMAQKWRVLRNTILVGPEKATIIVLAIMTLHNFMRSEVQYMPKESEIPEFERRDGGATLQSSSESLLRRH